MDIRQLSQLISYIVSLGNDMDGYITTIRLVKYLYLIDLEYYRVRRTTMTGLNWVFHLYGPYAFKIPLAGKILGYNLDREEFSTSSFHKGIVFRTLENIQTPKWIDFTSQSIIERILNVWIDQDTPTLLDYVYNQTEPMQIGQRGKPLDFSVINPGTRYFSFEIKVDQKVKSRLLSSLKQNRLEESSIFEPVKVLYDDLYSDAKDKIFEEDDIRDLSGIFFENPSNIVE